jgi:hypothetical protein
MTPVRGAALFLLLLTPAVLAACGTDAVRVEEPPMSGPTRGVCERLVSALPEEVADQSRRDVDPEGVLGAAWGDPEIVLTCGVGAPQDYDPANGCTTVDGVDWYIPVSQLEANGERDLTMTTIEREVAVRVEMPGEHWPPATTLADLSDVVAEHTERTGRCR